MLVADGIGGWRLSRGRWDTIMGGRDLSIARILEGALDRGGSSIDEIADSIDCLLSE